MFDSVDQFEGFSKDAIERADAIRKMTQTEGWKFVQEFLSEQTALLSQPAELYYRDPGLAGYHAGGQYILQQFNSLIETSLNIINDPKYDKEERGEDS